MTGPSAPQPSSPQSSAPQPTPASSPATGTVGADSRASSGATELSAAEIVAQLDRDTKISLVSGSGFWWTEALPQFGLEQIMVTDGPHGLRQQGAVGDHLGLAGSTPSTCFPPAVTVGSAWDVDLAHDIGVAIGEEANEQGVAVVLGPGLNLKRHPGGGRCFEYYSEDPLLGGKLAAAFVRGTESQGVGTSVKHFAVNNQETYRLVVDAVVDERTLRELYLSGFEIAVTEGRPSTVMSSYNRVNGTYVSEHHELLTSILREEWGFDGLIMSDWGGTNDRVAGIAAGEDLEMPGSKGPFDPEIRAALDSGALDEAALDACATRVVELIQRFQRPASGPSSDRDAHHQLARRAAAAGSVLLSNDGVLPLTPTGTIAVIGSFATSPRYQGAGSSQVSPTRLDNALDALRERVGTDAIVRVAEGFDAKTGNASPAQLDEAVAVATDADVAVVFAGLPARFESEGFDRTTLDLPSGVVALIEAVAATGTPVVVVLNNGGVVHLPWADRVNAVLECWLGGQAGGPAMVDVLFGDAEPGGRLAETIPVHQAQLPVDRFFPGEPRQVQYREGLFVGYRFHDTAGVEPRFAFGHGLSYTSFEWGTPKVTGSGTDLAVSVTVTNAGDRRSSDVVQLYVRDVDSTLRRPDKELRAFAKVHLDPGESTTVTLPLDRRAFAVWDVSAHDWLVEAGEFELVVARSAADIHASIAVTVESDDVVAPMPTPKGYAATETEFVALLGHALPSVPADRPFHRNSTLSDLETTKIGNSIAKQVLREGVKRASHEFPDPDEATLAMIESAFREGPLRALVLLSRGVVPFDAIDGVIDALNKDWSGVASRAKRALKR